jgi:hypothetical protein
LLVIALLVVLTTLYLKSTTGNRQRQAMAGCSANLQKAFIAMQIYANDSSGNLPGTGAAQTSQEALDPLVPRYTADTSTFVCPSSEDAAPAAGQSLSHGHISYSYYLGRHLTDGAEALLTDRQVDTLPKAVGQPVFSASGKGPGSNHGKEGGNLLLCTGEVKTSPPAAAFALPLPAGVRLLSPK